MLDPPLSMMSSITFSLNHYPLNCLEVLSSMFPVTILPLLIIRIEFVILTNSLKYDSRIKKVTPFLRFLDNQFTLHLAQLWIPGHSLVHLKIHGRGSFKNAIAIS